MSETDDQTPRRPPTIELAATEVDGSADKATAGEADAGTTGAAEHGTAGPAAAGSAPSGRRLTSHVASAFAGAGGDLICAARSIAMSRTAARRSSSRGAAARSSPCA